MSLVLIVNQGFTKVVTIHPERDMNVFTEFHGNPPNSCWDTSLKTITFNVMVAQEKNQEINVKVIRIHCLGTTNICTKLYSNPSSRCWDISQDK